MKALHASSVLLSCFHYAHSLSSTSKTSRRIFLTHVSAFGLTAAPAMAIQQKNDALCGTGFFTHIYEYKCTEIGDIEDEGSSKKLSSTEESSIDSLMSKFDLGAVETQNTDSATERSTGENQPKKE